MIVLQQSKCNRCGVCFDVCPFGVLGFNEQTRKLYIVDNSNCIDCGACALQCPMQAISVNVQGCGCIWDVTRRKLNQKKEKSIRTSPCCCPVKDRL